MAEFTSTPGETPKKKNVVVRSANKVATKTKHYLEGSGPRLSRPLLGTLPLRRWIPQDVHSVMDYVGALTVAGGALAADTVRAQAVGLSTGAALATASAMTDYRLSVARVLPIEVHEVLDYLSGAFLIAAPFALGYFKKDKICSAVHIANGAVLVLTSLFTDYRAHKGVGRMPEGEGTASY